MRRGPWAGATSRSAGAVLRALTSLETPLGRSAMSHRAVVTAREAQARLTAARRYSGGSAGAILKSRHVAPPAGRISGRGFGGGHRRGSRRGPCLVVAKIWTDDGRRKAAEMMGLTTEVRLDPPRLILIVRF